ncbi:unnamed protein product, partial [marine sediment metagenome]
IRKEGMILAEGIAGTAQLYNEYLLLIAGIYLPLMHQLALSKFVL